MLIWLTPAAHADIEPNDVISAAEGPIAGGTVVSGALATRNDVDVYEFYAQGPQQIHLTPQNRGLDEDGDPCAQFAFAGPDGAFVPGTSWTTPSGYQRLYVIVSRGYCSAPTLSYSFQIDPVAALTTGPALDRTSQQTTEPNETRETAAGPLMGGINYTGAFDTSNDQDWFYFYTAPGDQALDISVTVPSTDTRDSDCIADDQSAYVYLGGDPYTDESAGGGGFSIGHVRTTVDGGQKYYLRVDTSDCLGGHWQFRIDPPGAIVPALPASSDSAAADACYAAQLAEGKWQHRVNVLSAKRRSARTSRARRAAGIQLRASRKVLRRRQQQRRALC